ncbi:MAG TPA: hypothetical protein HPP51_05440 [Planctomycetes bacterium]|nr:hypothetical protein [Planctomycetota bacterium]
MKTIRKLFIVLAVLFVVVSTADAQRWFSRFQKDTIVQLSTDVNTLETNQGTLRDSVVQIYAPPRLMLAFKDSATTISVDSAVFAVVTNATDSLWVASGSGITAADDSATIVTDGDYFASLSLSYSANDNDTVQVALFKNGVITSVKAEKTAVGTDVSNVALSELLVGLNAGDDITVRIANSADGDDPTVIDGSLVMYMIKPD